MKVKEEISFSFEFENDDERVKAQVLEWLFHPVENRRAGRTELMAAVFVKLALQNEGKSIRLIDHTGCTSGNSVLLDRVKKIIFNDIPDGYTFELSGGVLKFTGKE